MSSLFFQVTTMVFFCSQLNTVLCLALHTLECINFLRLCNPVSQKEVRLIISTRIFQSGVYVQFRCFLFSSSKILFSDFCQLPKLVFFSENLLFHTFFRQMFFRKLFKNYQSSEFSSRQKEIVVSISVTRIPLYVFSKHTCSLITLAYIRTICFVWVCFAQYPRPQT